jgi:hypothetical protein
MDVQRHWRKLAVSSVLALVVAIPSVLAGAGEPVLTKAEMEHFLLTAKVVKSKYADKGATFSYRLTLKDGSLTHDAHFQSIDDREAKKTFKNGTVVLDFVDSYKYNIAAYRIADLVGLDRMVPMSVERTWKGHRGSLDWWLPVVMDEADRQARHVEVPDRAAWDRQMNTLRVFNALIDDSDSNLTNYVMDANWNVYRVDFSRAFRLQPTVRQPDELVPCKRDLLAKIRALTPAGLAASVGPFLTEREQAGVMSRRDDIVRRLDRLIAEKGAAAVLFD